MPPTNRRRQQQRKAIADAGQHITDAGERGAAGQHGRDAETLRHQAGRNLPARQRARIDAAQQTELPRSSAPNSACQIGSMT